ncbi:TIGR03084 family metal-binding protein [Mycobacterium sp. CVI_P3]|uniref:TIGR03084 family metal-binding protein n=1 Tax=Mycobacterium pinniadriaticum TaxID=2994102 RepID=A0ABT3S8B6_9MYCO|nr:TIGR03084 family metal-binding protein [Mycobacterium pinniadriaticum]MCX2929305.1 TIGR03084 family metal-binding protein [Mycobacterium pinniadriaticum]MCX2935729.1 TIGR03084 family metal-binding protein [Mycobacterium pinniadriaticum]
MTAADPIVDDLRDESDALDALVAPLDPAGWAQPTPAPGWTIAHQIAHLLWTDRVALLSITDEPAFDEQVTAAAADPLGFVDKAAEELALMPPADLLAQWRRIRTQLHTALRGVAEGRKLAWFGPPMSAASMATARLMETWAHGLDVADALGVVVAPSARLKSIAHLGVRTRDFAFAVHGLTPPAEAFRVELTAPDGSQWTWGADDAAERVTGSAVDFCYLVTQRRPRAELDVVADGPDAARWLDIAQAFAGPPGQGR